MKVTHWRTWQNKHKPKRFIRQDSTLGTVYLIEPTLKELGFWHTREEITDNEKPSKLALKEAERLKDKYTECVYYVYIHSRGYCKYLELFFK